MSFICELIGWALWVILSVMIQLIMMNILMDMLCLLWILWLLLTLLAWNKYLISMGLIRFTYRFMRPHLILKLYLPMLMNLFMWLQNALRKSLCQIIRSLMLWQLLWLLLWLLSYLLLLMMLMIHLILVLVLWVNKVIVLSRQGMAVLRDSLVMLELMGLSNLLIWSSSNIGIESVSVMNILRIMYLLRLPVLLSILPGCLLHLLIMLSFHRHFSISKDKFTLLLYKSLV